MSNWKRISAVVQGMLFVSGVAGLSCSDEAAGLDELAKDNHQKVIDVKVLVAEPQTFVDYVEITGSVQADIATTVSAEEPGVIAEIVRDKGDKVEKGDVIFTLKSQVLKASFDEAEAAYQLSRVTFERQANLHKDGVISEQKYLDFKYNLARDKARFENLQARLAKTSITSPIAGVIDYKHVELGEYVQPGTPLVKLVKTDIVKVTAGLPERYVREVWVGSQANITFDVLPEQTFAGEVSFVGPSIQKSSRTIPVEIKLANSNQLLKPGMFANISIRNREMRDAIVVPRDAIIETERGKFVFVAEGGAAVKREVQIGGSYQNSVWLARGVSAGDSIVTVGHRDLIDGETILIHD